MRFFPGPPRQREPTSEISRLRRRKDPIGRIAPDAVAISKALQGQGARTAAIANGGIVD
jgi:hypothetical protein